MTRKMLALVSVLAIAIPTFAQGPFTSLIFGGAARSGAGLLGRGLFAEAAVAEVAAAEGMAARGAMRSFSSLGRGWLAAEEGVIAAESRALAHPMSRGLFRSGGMRWGSTALAAEEGFIATESRLATRGAMRGMGRGILAVEEGAIAAETRVLAHPMARTGGNLFRRGGSGGLLSAEAEAAVAAETRIASHPMAGGPSIRKVNLGYPADGRTHNCVNCAIATDATLAGRPASALTGSATPIVELEKQFGRSFGPAQSRQSITSVMSEAGPGSRGIVFGQRSGGQTGHVFNVINERGKVRFLDGQTGQAASFDGFSALRLLRTN